MNHCKSKRLQRWTRNKSFHQWIQYTFVDPKANCEINVFELIFIDYYGFLYFKKNIFIYELIYQRKTTRNRYCLSSFIQLNNNEIMLNNTSEIGMRLRKNGKISDQIHSHFSFVVIKNLNRSSIISNSKFDGSWIFLF